MGRINRWSEIAGGVCALLLATVGPAFAVDGGVTFTNVATAANGITFARTPSPRLAKRGALQARSPLPLASFFTTEVPNTPQKPWGVPGVAIFDYDNDGDLDIYVTNGPGTPNSLYKNMLKETGKLTFVDVGAASGAGLVSQDSAGVCFGDVDNDGNDDLYVVGTGGPNALLHNNGNGTFTEITTKAGVAGPAGWNPSGCSMADFNNDGLLDIAVSYTHDDWGQRGPVFGTSVYWPTTERNLLFMNLGLNRFSEQGEIRGLDNYAGVPADVRSTYTWSVAAVDYNQDGAVDLMWSDSQGSQSGPNAGLTRIFENDGTGFFTDVTLARGLDYTNNTGSWMGFSFGDYNCDGYLDFFNTNLGRYVGGSAAINSRWYLGGPKGFVDPGVGSLVGTPFGWGTASFDYDNDGDTDIVWYGSEDLTNIFDTDNPGVLLTNTGSCTANFTWDKTALTNQQFRNVQGVAIGDLNGDGFDDIVSAAAVQVIPVTSPTNRNVLWSTILGGATGSVFDSVSTGEVIWTSRIQTGFMTYIPHSFNPGDLHVEVNSANNGNKWMQVRLQGTKGLTTDGRVNWNGFGAIAKFTPAGGKRSIRPVGGSSYASQNSKITTFGMGSATTGTLEVQWPGANGGVRNRLYNVKAGEKILLPEIPCAYDSPRFGRPAANDYVQCVSGSLAQLVSRHVISGQDSRRLRLSAFQAYNESHPGAHL